MKKILILVMSLTLLSSTCQKKDFHSYIILKNQSEHDVYLCMNFTNFEGKCTIHRFSILEKNSIKEWQPFRLSIEKSMSEVRILEFYFVDPNHYNEHNVFYDCDSITIKNNILKHYQLTLEDLKQSNFTIIYP